MKAVRLAELRDLLQGAPFTGWWTDLARATRELADARARHLDLAAQAELMEHRSELVQRTAVDAFSDAGEAEEVAARNGAEAQELENRALGLVGRYEEQRLRTSDVWYRMGGTERSAEEATDPTAKGALEKQLAALRQEYAVEDKKRDALWADVEASWASSFERSLLASEHADRSRRIRREAERLFKEAEERRLRAAQLRAEADAAGREHDAATQRRAELLDRARRELGCAAEDRFLYWRNADDKRSAFAVALADDADGYAVPVKALEPYAVGPQRGVAALEPAREGLSRTVEEGDRRFAEYLLGPRKGARGGEGAGPGDGPATT
jgi:hypothetical protein